MAHSTELFERSALNDTPSRIELTKCMLVFLRNVLVRSIRGLRV